MTVDAFRRLALLGCCSLYALAVSAAAAFIAWWAAPVMVLGGAALAALVSIEAQPEPEPAKVNGDTNPDRPKGFLRLPGTGGER